MKKIFTLILLALIVQIGFAQDEKVENKDDMKTIFTKENLKFTGGFIAPEIKAGDVHEDISMFVGGKLGFTFNNKFSLGLAGYGLVSNSNFILDETVATPKLASVDMGYGGLLLEYTLFSNKMLHFTIPVVAGVGNISIYEDNNENVFYFNRYFDEIESSSAFVVEPGVNIELNIFKFFRVDLGASYRLVSGSSLEYLQDDDLSDLTFNATFKFGFF